MRPLDFQCTLHQRFGENANGYYSSQGLKGHTGCDESCGYGSDLTPYARGIVFAVHTPAKPASDGYTAIYTLCQTPLEWFELSYGHVSAVNVEIGDSVEIGQVIGKEGNKGVVYQGGQLITLAMQKAGDKRGSHRHVQKRPVYRVKDGADLLRNAKGVYRDEEGYAYQVAEPNNGYKGCTDFAGELWTRDLMLGSSGYHVYLLQKALTLQGFLHPTHEPTTTFGPKTFTALCELQRRTGITATGYFGPKTRATLNAFYKTL